MARDALSYPVPVSDRISIIYLEKALLERDGNALVSISGATRTVIPVGITAVIMLGPGTTVSHAAVSLCSLEKAILIWVGEGGVRMYATAGQHRSDQILHQSALRLNPSGRLTVARRIFQKMFDQEAPLNRSIEQLRGLEGSKVKMLLQQMSIQNKLEWSGRTMDLSDPVNLAISTSTAALYGICEAAIVALGYSPAIGFVHSGDSRSFVFDIADTIKFKTVVPLAFKIVAEGRNDIERRVRIACRDLFVRERLLAKIVQMIEEVMYAANTD
jgi:CRISPR-associated protein Cas1